MRETHHTPSPQKLLASIPPNQKKSMLDCWNGYHSLQLNEIARDATTFITEWGQYHYKRVSQGFHSSGDEYMKRTDIITDRVDNLKKCIDDSCLEQCFLQTVKYVNLWARNGMVFNPEKFVFRGYTMEFAEFDMTKDGYKHMKKMLDSIANFPVPIDLTRICSWFGLVQQVAYSSSKTMAMTPFRDLLKCNMKFYCENHLEELFLKSHKVIMEKVKEGMKAFEIAWETMLVADWSKTGVGFMLEQKHCECKMTEAPYCRDDHWKLILAGSRFKSNT